MNFDLNEILSRKEELCDELKVYQTTGEMFEMVKHPLVFSVPYHPQMNAFLNLQLKEKIKIKEELLSERSFSEFILLHEKPYRLFAFLEIKDKVSDVEYWELLSFIWTNSENIWQNIDKWKYLLSSERKGKVYFMSKKDTIFFKHLPDVIAVYRGYIPGQNKNGLSYSLSKEKALWFANRCGDGKIIKKVIGKSKVFAFLDNRNEKEIIIL